MMNHRARGFNRLTGSDGSAPRSVALALAIEHADAEQAVSIELNSLLRQEPVDLVVAKVVGVLADGRTLGHALAEVVLGHARSVPTLSHRATEQWPMARLLKIVGLGGSLAAISRSRAALATALEGAEEAGAVTELLDIRELDLPMYNPDA